MTEQQAREWPKRARSCILVLANTVPGEEDDGTPAFVVTLAQALSRR